MIECINVKIKDQLPGFAANTLNASERSAVENHVAECAACKAEIDVLNVVLAARIPVPYMNVARIVQALPPAPIPVHDDLPWFRRASLPLAASLLLVAGGLVAVRQAGNRVETQAAVAQVAAVAQIALVSGLDELSTQELAALLEDIDGISAVPLAEPEQFTPVTSVSDSQGES